MSKKRKLESDHDELLNQAQKLYEEKSSNITTKPFTKFLAEENFKTIHIRSSEIDSFKEIHGRVLCENDSCKHKAFKNRVS